MAKKKGSSPKKAKAAKETPPPKEDKENKESNDKKVSAKKESPTKAKKSEAPKSAPPAKENRKRKADSSVDKDKKQAPAAANEDAEVKPKEHEANKNAGEEATAAPNDANDDGDDSKPAAVETKPEIDLTKPIKRARTPYFIFSDEHRAEIQAKHKGEGVATIAKELGALWSKMSAKDKEVYQEKAALERERVAQQLAQLQAAGIVLSTLPGAAQATETNATNALIFPLARMRKIVKLDPEVKGLSKEALLLVTKCTELMTGKLGIETVRVAQIQNRRKLLPDDIANVTQTREQFLFLRDDVKDFVREQVVQKQKDKEASGAASAATSSKEAKAASNSRPLTSYFAAAK